MAGPGRAAMHQLKLDEQAEFFVVLVDKKEKLSKFDKPFWELGLRDAKKTAKGFVWNDSPLFRPCGEAWPVGTHLRMTGKLSKFGVTIVDARPATDADRADGYDPKSFDAGTRFDVEELFAAYLALADSIADPPLRALVRGLAERHADALKLHPAAARNHHAYRGGLLEHLVSVARTGVWLAEKYVDYYPDLRPPVSRDLVVAGCLLHDLGKLDELEQRPEQIVYTPRGQLVGHVLVGRDMVRDFARELPGFDPVTLLVLEHIVLSHQGTKEWDSPKEPACPEALLVHYADDIDAKMNMFANIIETSDGGDGFTDANNIFRRRLFKGR